LSAGDWPQWRGPSSQGISAETGLPSRWSAHENVAWKAALAGFGASSPIVSGDIVIVTSQIGSYTGRNREYPRLARDAEELAAREHAIGGPKMASAQSAGGDGLLAVEAFRRAGGQRVLGDKDAPTSRRAPKS